MGKRKRGAAWNVGGRVLVLDEVLGSQKTLRSAAEYEPANMTSMLEKNCGRAARAERSSTSGVSRVRRGLWRKCISRRDADWLSPSMRSTAPVGRFRMVLAQRLIEVIVPSSGIFVALWIAPTDRSFSRSRLRCSPSSKASRRRRPADRVSPSRFAWCNRLRCSISLKFGTFRTPSKTKISKSLVSIVLC